jgi:hypothetical protein
METVTVGCKIPNGLILSTKDKTGLIREVRLNGNRHPIHPKTGRELTHKFDVVAQRTSGTSGYGITKNVPKDLWEKIAEESKDTPAFRNMLVFAVGDELSAKSMATEISEDFPNNADPIEQDKLGAKLKAINPTNEEEGED